MDDTSCPYHTEHSSRLQKLEQNYDNLDDRVVILDKEFAVNRAEITGALKNLEKLPETMTQISNTMITIQNEIKNSNTRIDTRMEVVDSRMEGMESKLSDLDKKVLQADEDWKINIRKGFMSWFSKNWMYLGLGILLASLYLTDIVKNMVLQ